MADIILNKHQLQQLMQYIYTRGFSEPFVAMEILDHFACKVEEKLQQNPSLTLQAAMGLAHRDFGPLGFYPIVTAYQATLQKKYKKLYAQERKKLLLSAPHIIMFILTGFLLFKAFCWAEINHYGHVLGINDTFVASYLLVTISFILLRRKSPKLNDIDIIKRTILSLDQWAIYGTTFIISQAISTLLNGPHPITSPVGITIFGAIFSGIFTYILIRYFALGKTLGIASEEINEISATYYQLMG